VRVTEHEIFWLLSGAVIGWLLTYWHLTKEKRIISYIRDDIGLLIFHHELSKAQWRRVQGGQHAIKELAHDQLVLEFFRWAQEVRNDYHIQGVKKIHPIRLAAEAIICQELLGLPHAVALRVLLHIKTLDEIRALQLEIQGETKSPAET
jgi:hypothetical protein